MHVGSRTPNGRWTSGTSGNPSGRRSHAIDFAKLVREETGPGEVDAALVRVYRKLLAQAESGDVQAARLLLDRLCLAPALAIEFEPPEIEMSRTELARKLTGTLALAVHERPDLAAILAGIALRGVNDPKLDEVADALEAAYPKQETPQ